MEPTFNNYPLLPNNVGKESINNLETIRVVTTLKCYTPDYSFARQ